MMLRNKNRLKRSEKATIQILKPFLLAEKLNDLKYNDYECSKAFIQTIDELADYLIENNLSPGYWRVVKRNLKF